MVAQPSPINIESKKAISNTKLKSLYIDYNDAKPLTIQNTGKIVKINFKGGYIGGGFLTNDYKLSKLQIYWGKENDYGSNHLIDVYKYSGEINLIHWNKKYNSYENAKKHNDGIVIISIFLQVSDDKNVHFQKIVNQLDSIRQPNTSIPFDAVFHVDSLIPKQLDYFTYHGTTINNQSVDANWIIFSTPLHVHSSQIAKFRTLLSPSNHEAKPHYILENYKNPHTLNKDTRVYYSGDMTYDAASLSQSSENESYFYCWLSNLRDICFSYYQKYIARNKILAIIAVVLVFILTYILYSMSRRYLRGRQN
ncbi:IMV membrane protein [Raccoonpox virus]|uniref:Cell surface-binding protein OPG105 n=1 Tax=Raccoon poxvirus TaxID=10256 RepID=A0A0G3G2K7_RACVI|nr:IMV membrane protein [Raccoonpox virus]AKJ93742.1 IMV membrane protein [Raccoonpox virus]